MYRLLFFHILGIIGFSSLIACSSPVDHGSSSSSSNNEDDSYTYTGNWDLTRVYCGNLLVRYSGFTEQLTLNQENEEGTFTVSNSRCETKVNFDITKQGNRLTATSRNTLCSPQSCSITPTFRIGGRTIEESYSCPGDIPSSITAKAILSDDYEKLTVNISLSNSSLECELIFNKEW